MLMRGLMLIPLCFLPAHCAPSLEVSQPELNRLETGLVSREKRQAPGVFFGCGGLCLGQICPIGSVCAGVNTECKVYSGFYGICRCLPDFISNPGGQFTEIIGQSPIYGCYWFGGIGFTTQIPALGIPGNFNLGIPGIGFNGESQSLQAQNENAASVDKISAAVTEDEKNQLLNWLQVAPDSIRSQPAIIEAITNAFSKK